jgi:hypothetical protein
MIFTFLQGQTDPPYSPTLTDTSGAAFNLTGYTASAFTIKFECVSNGAFNGQLKTGGTGSSFWAIVNATGGQIAYQWQTSDTNTPGTWQIFVYVTTLTGTVRKFLPDTMIIEAAP